MSNLQVTREKLPTGTAEPQISGFFSKLLGSRPNGRRVSRGHFRVVGCGAFRLDFDGGLGGEAEETALFLPVMRQVLRFSARGC
jgi:hypothetical protein